MFTAVAESVPGTIARFPQEEQVDLIALCGSGGTGLAREVQGSMASESSRMAHVQMKLFSPSELAPVG